MEESSGTGLQGFKFNYGSETLSLLLQGTKKSSLLRPPRIRNPGKNAFQRHSRLSMAIANHNLEGIDDILKDYYLEPKKPSQVLWPFCSLCQRFMRQVNMKKVMFMMERGIREIVWRATPDFLDLGYILVDSLKLKSGNRNLIGSPTGAIEGAITFALGYSSIAVIRKLVRAGACLNCLAVCFNCFQHGHKCECSCVEFSPLYQPLALKSAETEILEIATLLIMHSGTLIPGTLKPATSKYLTEAIWFGNFKAIKLLVDAGEDPTRVAEDGSTVVSSKLRIDGTLELTIAIILYMIKCHGQYTTENMNSIMFPGKTLDSRRSPTLEFVVRMIITAIFGEWDPTLAELALINVTHLFEDESWMRLSNGTKTRQELEVAALVLLRTVIFPSAQERLSLVTQDWINYLTQKSLKHVSIPDDNLRQPASLKETARYAIRRHAKPPLFQSLESLRLPSKMEEYVMMAEELAGLVSIRSILTAMKKMENS